MFDFYDYNRQKNSPKYFWRIICILVVERNIVDKLLFQISNFPLFCFESTSIIFFLSAHFNQTCFISYSTHSLCGCSTFIKISPRFGAKSRGARRTMGGAKIIWYQYRTDSPSAPHHERWRRTKKTRAPPEPSNAIIFRISRVFPTKRFSPEKILPTHRLRGLFWNFSHPLKKLTREGCRTYTRKGAKVFP